MSFSKAKVQRFNEVKAPISVSHRTVCDKAKLKSKIVNHVKPDEKIKSDTGSSQSVPCFRTPTLLRKKPKKIVTTNQTSKVKSKELITADQSIEALKEKIVECENKDAYIKDLTQQLEEFKDRINKIENETSSPESDQDRFNQTIENLKNEHENKIKIIQEEFRLRLSDMITLKEKIASQLSLLKDLVLTCNAEMQDLKKNCNELPNYFRKYFEQYQDLIEQKQSELNEKEHLLRIVEQNSIEMQRKHSLEIEKLRKEQQVEIQDLEFEMLKTMTELQRQREVSKNKIREVEEEMRKKIEEMREVFETDKEKIVCQSEKKLKQMEETFQKLNSIPEKELEKKLTTLEAEWKEKLAEQQKQSDAILKECQAISEYNIIQCEIEKATLAAELKENIHELKKVESNYSNILDSFKNLKNTCEDLKEELKSKKAELDATKKDLIEELQKCKKKLNEVVKEKGAYEFTIKNSQLTIDVLKRRLIHSDKDVEQLKEELSECEKKLLEYEEKNCQLSSDLKQAHVFNEELEMQFESTIKLNCTDIDNMGIQLLKEVKDYKEEVVKYKKQIQDEHELKKDIMQQLHDAHEIINKIRVEFENVGSLCSHYKFEVEQSQNELEDYHMREMDWNIVKDKLEYTIKEVEDLLESKVSEIDDLKNEVIVLREKSNSYCNSLEYYQQKVQELEEEQKETGNIHKKYIEMSGKYDVLSWKFEELEAENLQNKMRLMKLSDDQADRKAFKVKYDNQMTICNELEVVNKALESEIEDRIKEETSLREDFNKIKAERDALSNKVQQLETELNQMKTPKKSKKIKQEEDYSDPKKWMKKNKHDKENISSPNRTLNSSRIDSPLRDRN